MAAHSTGSPQIRKIRRRKISVARVTYITSVRDCILAESYGARRSQAAHNGLFLLDQEEQRTTFTSKAKEVSLGGVGNRPFLRRRGVRHTRSLSSVAGRRCRG